MLPQQVLMSLHRGSIEYWVGHFADNRDKLVVTARAISAKRLSLDQKKNAGSVLKP